MKSYEKLDFVWKRAGEMFNTHVAKGWFLTHMLDLVIKPMVRNFGNFQLILICYRLGGRSYIYIYIYIYIYNPSGHG